MRRLTLLPLLILPLLAAAQEDEAGRAAPEAGQAAPAAPDSTSEITVSMGPARDAEREA